MEKTMDKSLDGPNQAQKSERAAPDPMRQLLFDTELKLEQWTEALAAKVDKAQVQAHLGLMELEARWESARDGFAKQVEKMKAATQTVQAQAESVRLQGHLAKSEARDAIADMRAGAARIEAKIENLMAKVEADTKKALNRVSKCCKDLGRKLEA